MVVGSGHELMLYKALTAIAAHWAMQQTVLTVHGAECFIAISMSLLALQKLKDVDGFATMFFN